MLHTNLREHSEILTHLHTTQLQILPLRQYVSTYDITIGASAGCAPALFLALGLDAEQAIEESNKANFADFFDGGRKYPGPTKAVGQLYNVYYEGGMHPGKTCVEFFGDILE